MLPRSPKKGVKRTGEYQDSGPLPKRALAGFARVSRGEVRKVRPNRPAGLNNALSLSRAHS